MVVSGDRQGFSPLRVKPTSGWPSLAALALSGIAPPQPARVPRRPRLPVARTRPRRAPIPPRAPGHWPHPAQSSALPHAARPKLGLGPAPSAARPLSPLAPGPAATCYAPLPELAALGGRRQPALAASMPRCGPAQLAAASHATWQPAAGLPRGGRDRSRVVFRTPHDHSCNSRPDYVTARTLARGCSSPTHDRLRLKRDRFGVADAAQGSV